MKITRQKRIRRYLKFYINHFQFKLPYQILIDGTFCHEALQSKINIKKQVPQYLDDEKVRLFTTSCVIKEMQLLGPRVYGALHIVKQFQVRKCGHEKDSLSASDCILSMVEKNNPNHFIVATTDRDLSEKCRLVPGIPILFVKYNAIILEKPSGMNLEVAQEKMRFATELSEFEKKQLESSKIKSEDIEEPKRKKRKGPKEPNPLSCLKKKKKPLVLPSTEKEGVKRKRNRKRNKKSLPIVE